MIFCPFCHYYNNEVNIRCEKCGNLLREDETPSSDNQKQGEEESVFEEKQSHIADNSIIQEVQMESVDDFSISTAIQENDTGGIAGLVETEDEGDNCTECSYLLRVKASLCPNCLHDNTIRKSTLPKMGLQSIQENRLLEFEGNEILLKRNNVDVQNKSISSQEHALITYEDGKWILRDKSSNKATFLQVTEAVEIKDGTLLMLGNALYRFKVRS